MLIFIMELYEKEPSLKWDPMGIVKKMNNSKNYNIKH